jgi:putative ATPase
MSVLDRAMGDERGLAGRSLVLQPDAREALAERVGGDARLALTALEVAATLAENRGDGAIAEEDVAEALQRRIIRYDKAGDQHYDVVSAFIKSLRGSDPDAAMFWLHYMLDAGEDPEFIVRRMVIFASEDVGLADASALPTAMAAAAALAHVGLPEAAFALSHAALHLATAPKSNSVKRAMAEAGRLVADTPAAQVPPHLRSANYAGAGQLGHGVGYRYPHDYPDAAVAQQYLPDEATGRLVYRPGTAGDEAAIARRVAELDEQLGRQGRDGVR